MHHPLTEVLLTGPQPQASNSPALQWSRGKWSHKVTCALLSLHPFNAFCMPSVCTWGLAAGPPRLRDCYVPTNKSSLVAFLGRQRPFKQSQFHLLHRSRAVGFCERAKVHSAGGWVGDGWGLVACTVATIICTATSTIFLMLLVLVLILS